MLRARGRYQQVAGRALTVELRAGSAADSDACARLHVERISEGFLATLGPRFLTRLYRRVVDHPGGILVVAADDGGVVGFVAGVDHTGRLYRSFARRDGIAAGFAALPRLLRSPRRVWETFRYGRRRGGVDLPDAELLSLAVAANASGHGLGRSLTEALLLAFAHRRVDAVKVVVGARNTAALRTYESCGFVGTATIEVHRGEPSEVLVWRG